MKNGGLIEEKNCFKTEDEAKEAIKKLEKEQEGIHILYDVNGNIIKTYKIEKTPNKN
jgi:hypothetical protein